MATLLPKPISVLSEHVRLLSDVITCFSFLFSRLDLDNESSDSPKDILAHPLQLPSYPTKRNNILESNILKIVFIISVTCVTSNQTKR